MHESLKKPLSTIAICILLIVPTLLIDCGLASDQLHQREWYGNNFGWGVWSLVAEILGFVPIYVPLLFASLLLVHLVRRPTSAVSAYDPKAARLILATLLSVLLSCCFLWLMFRWIVSSAGISH